MVNRTSYFFRPGWPGSYDMSHREAESMLNYSSKFVFTYILGTIASCSPRETWDSLSMSYSQLSPKSANIDSQWL